jgi:hypothetical protein
MKLEEQKRVKKGRLYWTERTADLQIALRVSLWARTWDKKKYPLSWCAWWIINIQRLKESSCDLGSVLQSPGSTLDDS